MTETVRNERPSLRTQRDLRQHSEGGRQRRPDRLRAAVRGEGQAGRPDRPGAGRQPARLLGDPIVGDPGAALPPGRGSDHRPGSLPPLPCRGRRGRSPRSGCSQQNQRSLARRDPAAIATGSRSRSTSSVAETSLRGVRAGQRPLELGEQRPGVEGDAHPRQTGCAFAHPRIRTRAWSGRSRPRPCGPSRSGRGGGSCARRPRSCRRCRSPRSSASGARRRRSWRGRSRRTA